ncbi:hypothetical protein BDN71DRAFT_1432338 [Pleurotus eryngii]|uniref:Uncharacterized protein n=1 Tax=Pleurotus eryngii TaxID=5323 RepID=A0A9P6DE30_PLEER|nr:hypothetical protein BDN71DRAFT_1432338 [Pleurotus eryngii]
MPNLRASMVGAVTVFYLLSWLDRTNLGNARIADLQTDLRLADNQHPIPCGIKYSISLTITLMYATPVSGAHLIDRIFTSPFIVGPNILMPAPLTLWGIVTTLQGTVHTFGGSLACRFFLGFFEGIVLHRTRTTSSQN